MEIPLTNVDDLFLDDEAAYGDDTEKEAQKENATTRAYQLEMFEKSMLSNIIVTMSTGSGKTWIAKLRIEAALIKQPEKLVWFTAPSVVLAQQQHKYLSRHLLSTTTRLIIGSDNTHLWSTQELWDAILDVQLIVSTPQVLLEGLQLGFVKLQSISLLVIDEAHHCIAKHPTNITMQSFYHEARRANGKSELPCILGMTASPITTKLAGMDILESNLDAMCKSPTQQIDEYREYVHLPAILELSYAPNEGHPSLPVESMLRIFESIDMSDDPWIEHLSKEETQVALEKLAKALETKSTFSMDQLKKLQGNTQHIYTQLGSWAANFWLSEVLLKLHFKVENQDWLTSLSDEENRYLDKSLSKIRDLTSEARKEDKILQQLSAKAERLIEFLAKEYAQKADICSVIFVERRSTAYALTKLLQRHPSIACTVTSFVGASNAGRKANLIDLADIATQNTELDEFRSSLRSIVVATAVMEEGIDIQAVNLVVLFDQALTMRSYIQRRGRARKVSSKFVLMRSNDERPLKSNDWVKLEADMKARYMDEMRQLKMHLDLESEDEDDNRVYIIEATGARLTFGNARALLEHYCASLKKVQFEPNTRPTFICHGTHGIDMSAKVLLPSSLPTEIKEVYGSSIWRTEKAAKRDASFEAVKKLHEIKLIDDHFLPPASIKRAVFVAENRASFADIKPQKIPWLPVSQTDEQVLLYAHRLELNQDVTSFPYDPLLLLLPAKLKSIISIPLHYTTLLNLEARVSYAETRSVSIAVRALAQEVTRYLLRTCLAKHTHEPESWTQGFPFLILPDNIPDANLREWFEETKRSSSLAKMLAEPASSCYQSYVVQDTQNSAISISNLERINLMTTHSLYGLPEAVPAISVRRLPKRIDYLTQANVPSAMVGKQSAIPIDKGVLLHISPSIINTMQFVPSIIRTIGFSLTASLCCNHLLPWLRIKNEKRLLEALTSPHAYGHTNYERLEFFGDTLLKFYACLQVYTDPKNVLLPECYLTNEETKLVSNARLHRAALDLGLDEFMIHESFVPRAWKPETSISQQSRPHRETSTKTIADHVEAILAVAYLEDAGIDTKDFNAIAFLDTILPEVHWKLPQKTTADFLDQPFANAQTFDALSLVESILGYKFQQRHLLAEALNHSSVTISIPTYGRLEFLGDAVLQRIVNEEVYNANARYSQEAMHLRQIACVSHSYLAYLCLGAQHDVEKVNVTSDLEKQEAKIVRTTEKKYLWEYMIHSNAAIAPAQQSSHKRYVERCEQIQRELETSKTYPWALLASLDAPKFLSDIMESVLGAIFLDCNADLAICTRVLDNLGMTKLLRRLVNEPDMILAQPKSILWEGRAKAGLPSLKIAVRWGKEMDGRKYTCQLLMPDGEVYAGVEGTCCEEEAMLRACEVGLDRFRREGREEREALEVEKKRKRGDSLESTSSSTTTTTSDG